jgi:hypothetical protein
MSSGSHGTTRRDRAEEDAKCNDSMEEETTTVPAAHQKTVFAYPKVIVK